VRSLSSGKKFCPCSGRRINERLLSHRKNSLRASTHGDRRDGLSRPSKSSASRVTRNPAGSMGRLKTLFTSADLRTLFREALFVHLIRLRCSTIATNFSDGQNPLVVNE